jgi:basic membrane protein A
VSGHVFISYSRDDRTYVDALARHLERAGIPVWYDYEIAAGDRWEHVIRQQIDTCAAVIAVMSPAAEASTWVARELNHAENLNKPMLPVLLTGTVFFRLNHIQYEDVSGGRMPGPTFLIRLRAALNGSGGAPTPVPPARAAPQVWVPPTAPFTPPPAPSAPASPPFAPVPARSVPAPAPFVSVPAPPAPASAPARIEERARASTPPPVSPPAPAINRPRMPPPATPPELSPGTQPPWRRRPALLGSVGSAVAVILIISLVVWLPKHDNPASAPPSSTGTNSAGPGAGNAPKYVACMVTDQGGLDDKSFNASAWKGLQDAASDQATNVEIKNVPSTAEADYEPNLTSFVNQRCNFILSVGGLMGDATARVANANSTQQFAIVDDDLGVSNVYPMQFNVAQAAFLAGYLAAGYSKTTKVGTYGGLKIPAVTLFMDGFADGVAYYNQKHGKNVQVLGWSVAKQEGLFAGTFTSAAQGKSLSDTLNAEGADVIMPIAGGAGLGTLQEAAQGTFAAIWVDTDGCVDTDYCAGLLTSVQKNISGAVKDTVIRGAAGQSLTASNGYIGTLANGGVALAPYHDFDSKISSALKAEVDQLKQDIIAGRVSVQSPSTPHN